jgi:hypothetical protein
MNSGAADYTVRVFNEATSALLGSTVVHIVSPDIGLLSSWSRDTWSSAT